MLSILVMVMVNVLKTCLWFSIDILSSQDKDVHSNDYREPSVKMDVQELLKHLLPTVFLFPVKIVSASVHDVASLTTIKTSQLMNRKLNQSKKPT